MARRRKKEIKSSIVIELVGFFMAMTAVIGIFQYGIVGHFIKSAAVFLIGDTPSIFLGLIAVGGIFMMIKRENVKFFSSRTVGIYLLVIALLSLHHLNTYVNDGHTGLELIKVTFTDLINYIKGTTTEISGGGMIGGLFSYLLVLAFASFKDGVLNLTGPKIVSYSLGIGGLILFTGTSIYDIVNWSKEHIKTSLSKKDKKEIEIVQEDYDKDKKIIISSMDELKNKDIIKDNKEEVEVLDANEGKGYALPPLNLLNNSPSKKSFQSEDDINETVKVLESVFKDFALEGKVVAVNIGPAVTQYEMEVKAGTKVNRILGINREIALALAAKDVRIEAPIPGKRTVGIEIPNKSVSMVTLKELLEVIPKSLRDNKLLVTLGKDIMGVPKFTEINNTPHLLVAGATGSGKSVCINSMILTLLMRTRPDEVKLVLIDPKKVELSGYNGVPHLLAPVVTDPRKANIVLKKIVVEMERRYELFEESGTKNIAGYNTYIEKKNSGLSDTDKIRKLPYIVVFIDELADLMLVAAKEVEDSIMRITQMARASGIHLIVATQRPSTDVITGLVKSNIPSRISFAVSSQIDSRTILDMGGAEKLLSKGDMLFLPQGESTPVRIQGTYVSDEEIKKVIDYTVKQQKARYDENLTKDVDEMNATTMVQDDANSEPLYDEIVEFVIKEGKASASLLQRRFHLGYNRAARVVDLLEDRGIVGAANGSKPREVLVKLEDKNRE